MCDRVLLSWTKTGRWSQLYADFFVNVQAEKLEAAQSNLIHISISVNKALQQLDELNKQQQHIDDSSKE